MINGLGVDIIEIDRFDLENLSLIKYVLSPKELSLFYQFTSITRKKEFLSGR
jgi:phosphopantetheinyl transferase (holo-ACP synthase)